MPNYDYIARTKNGTLEKGVQKAKSPEMAREQLRKKGLIAEEVLEQHPAASPIGFTGSAMPWTATDEEILSVQSDELQAFQTDTYVPLHETVRLFAGWLLGWYGVVYALGSLQFVHKLSFDIPFLSGLFHSPLVLRFAFGTFFLIFLMTVHRWMKGGVGKGILLSITWVIGTLGYGMLI